EHIPLFDGNKFWGIYCIGPYMQSPENMMPKLKKAGALLCRWLIDMYEKGEENKPAVNEAQITKIKSFGAGELNIGEISTFLTSSMAEEIGIDGAAVINRHTHGPKIVSHYIKKEYPQDLFTEITATGLVQQSEDAITITDEAKRVLAKEGLSNYRLFPF